MFPRATFGALGLHFLGWGKFFDTRGFLGNRFLKGYPPFLGSTSRFWAPKGGLNFPGISKNGTLGPGKDFCNGLFGHPGGSSWLKKGDAPF